MMMEGVLLGLLLLLIFAILLSSGRSAYSSSSGPWIPPSADTTMPRCDHGSDKQVGYIKGEEVEPTFDNLSSEYFLWVCSECRRLNDET